MQNAKERKKSMSSLTRWQGQAYMPGDSGQLFGLRDELDRLLESSFDDLASGSRV